MMLHLHPDQVQMDKAQRDIGQLKLKYFNWDYPEPSAFAWQDWWSRFTRAGICGDAAAATPEFGRRMAEVTVERFVALVISQLAAMVREQAESAQRREMQAVALYELGRDLTDTTGLESVAQTVISHVGQTFSREVVVFLPENNGLRLRSGMNARAHARTSSLVTKGKWPMTSGKSWAVKSNPSVR